MWWTYQCERIKWTLEKTKDKCGDKFKWIEQITEPLLNNLNTNNMLSNIFAELTKKTICTYWLLWLDEYVLNFWINDAVYELCNTEIPSDIQQLAQARRQAKLNKDRASADNIKQQIISAGWEVKDDKDNYEIIKS